jgi:hypothetical protein
MSKENKNGKGYSHEIRRKNEFIVSKGVMLATPLISCQP